MSIKEILDEKFIKQISDTIVNSIEEAAKRVENDSRVMTQKRAAEYLGISVPTFILLKKSGEFTPIQYPGVNQLYYGKQDLDKFIAQSKIQ